MKIMICGSMAFSKDMIKTQKALTKMGHAVGVPVGIAPHLKDEDLVDNLSGNIGFLMENDVMRRDFKQVARSDAIVVLNYKRNNTDGYIGVSVLMEMGIAYFLKKKIFLLNPVPHYNDVRWAHEVTIMQPVVLHGDLTKVV